MKPITLMYPILRQVLHLSVRQYYCTLSFGSKLVVGGATDSLSRARLTITECVLKIDSSTPITYQSDRYRCHVMLT